VALDISEESVHEALNVKATEHCTSNRASRPRRQESVSTSVVLDGHSCLLPWMITVLIALDDNNCLPPWTITAFIALDDHNCLLPWMNATFIALDVHNCLLHWMIITVYCLGWLQQFTALDDHNFLLPWTITICYNRQYATKHNNTLNQGPKHVAHQLILCSPPIHIPITARGPAQFKFFFKSKLSFVMSCTAHKRFWYCWIVPYSIKSTKKKLNNFNNR